MNPYWEALGRICFLAHSDHWPNSVPSIYKTEGFASLLAAGWELASTPEAAMCSDSWPPSSKAAMPGSSSLSTSLGLTLLPSSSPGGAYMMTLGPAELSPYLKVSWFITSIPSAKPFTAVLGLVFDWTTGRAGILWGPLSNSPYHMKKKRFSPEGKGGRQGICISSTATEILKGNDS